MAEKAKKAKAEKPKKQKLGARRSASNISFAFRQVWEASRSYFVFYFVIVMLYAPLDFFTDSYLLRVIVDGVESGVDVMRIAVYITVVGLLSIGVNMLENFYWNLSGARATKLIGARLQKKLFKKASEVDISCYETPSFYDKYVKAFDETSNRVDMVMRTSQNLIWRVVTLVCNSFLLFVIDPWLMVFGLFPLFLGFVRRWYNKLHHDHVVAQKPVEREIKYIRRTFYLNDYSKEMRMGGMYKRMIAQLDATYGEFRRIRIKYGSKKAVAKYLQQVGLEVVTILGAMLYAVWRTVSDGSISIGDCIVILNSIGTISYCLNNLVSNLAEFGEHALFLEDVRYFLDYEPKIKEDVSAPDASAGELRLENVSFCYDGAEHKALDGISLHVAPGERVALVGHNGSGKTTLVKLLLRMYDPSEGEITLGGCNIKEYKLSSYRDCFSTVMQDYRVFSLSVEKNVTMRRAKDNDRELVTKALRESGAYEKIMTLEHGIDTTLTREFDEEGANLSGGEAQKVSLARVFSSSAPFIILDEPTSALDPVAEHKMFENMMRAADGRGVIFISHRLSSAVDADRIYLFEHGKIVEQGTHASLMAAGGKYADMFSLQAQSYIGEGVSAHEQ